MFRNPPKFPSSDSDLLAIIALPPVPGPSPQAPPVASAEARTVVPPEAPPMADVALEALQATPQAAPTVPEATPGAAPAVPEATPGAAPTVPEATPGAAPAVPEAIPEATLAVP